MKYDPNNELTDKQLEKLGEEDFDKMLEYLDSQTEYLKKLSKPLSSHHTKRFASMNAANQGKQLSEDELKQAENIGKKNEKSAIKKIREKEEQKREVLRNTGIDKIKTDRTQWFD